MYLTFVLADHMSVVDLVDHIVVVGFVAVDTAVVDLVVGTVDFAGSDCIEVEYFD